MYKVVGNPKNCSAGDSVLGLLNIPICDTRLRVGYTESITSTISRLRLSLVSFYL